MLACSKYYAIVVSILVCHILAGNAVSRLGHSLGGNSVCALSPKACCLFGWRTL